MKSTCGWLSISRLPHRRQYVSNYLDPKFISSLEYIWFPNLQVLPWQMIFLTPVRTWKWDLSCPNPFEREGNFRLTQRDFPPNVYSQLLHPSFSILSSPPGFKGEASPALLPDVYLDVFVWGIFQLQSCLCSFYICSGCSGCFQKHGFHLTWLPPTSGYVSKPARQNFLRESEGFPHWPYG